MPIDPSSVIDSEALLEDAAEALEYVDQIKIQRESEANTEQ